MYRNSQPMGLGGQQTLKICGPKFKNKLPAKFLQVRGGGGVKYILGRLSGHCVKISRKSAQVNSNYMPANFEHYINANNNTAVKKMCNKEILHLYYVKNNVLFFRHCIYSMHVP